MPADTAPIVRLGWLRGGSMSHPPTGDGRSDPLASLRCLSRMHKNRHWQLQVPGGFKRLRKISNGAGMALRSRGFGLREVMNEFKCTRVWISVMHRVPTDERPSHAAFLARPGYAPRTPPRMGAAPCLGFRSHRRRPFRAGPRSGSRPAARTLAFGLDRATPCAARPESDGGPKAKGRAIVFGEPRARGGATASASCDPSRCAGVAGNVSPYTFGLDRRQLR
jgi:hypothetical protein